MLNNVFNIMEAQFEKFMNFDVCVVSWCSYGWINSQEYKSFKFILLLLRYLWLNIIIW